MTERKTETVNDLSRCLDPLDMDATNRVGLSLALFLALSASR